MGYARVVGKCAAIYGQLVWRLSERTFSNKDDPGPIFFFLLKGTTLARDEQPKKLQSYNRLSSVCAFLSKSVRHRVIHLRRMTDTSQDDERAAKLGALPPSNV